MRIINHTEHAWCLGHHSSRENATSASLTNALDSSRILLDASFAMMAGFRDFVGREFTRGGVRRLLIPVTVALELNGHLHNPEKALKAGNAIEVVHSSIGNGTAAIVGGESDRESHADCMIQRSILQLLEVSNVTLLTNDVGLMTDCWNLTRLASTRFRRKLNIYKLHGKTQNVVQFRLNSGI